MFALFFIIVFTLLAIVTFGFWIYALVEIISDEFKNDTDKILWFLLVFFLPFVGTIVYYSIGRKKISLPQDEYV